MTEHPNPYAPPTTAGTSTPAELPVAKRRPKLAILSSGASAAAYLIFTCVLLSSQGLDRKAGLLFCLNVPVLLVWLVFTIRALRAGAYLGFAVVAIQGGITTFMLAFGIGDWPPVIAVNGIIMSLQAILALIAYLSLGSDAQNW